MITRMRAVRVVQTWCFAIIAFDAFFPYLVERLPSWGWLVPGTAWLAGLAELHRRQGRPGAVALWIAVPVAAACASYFFTTLPDFVLGPLGTLPDGLNQYLFVFPLLLVAGVVCAASPELRVLTGSLRLLGAVVALMALVERFSGHLFFSGNTVATNFGASHARAVTVSISDSGSVRGIVASYHPLVLGTLLAVVLSLALMRPGRRKPLEAFVLLAGIWATDSTGPLGIGLLLVLIAVLRALRERMGAAPVRLGAALGGYVLAVAVFLGLSAWVWQPVVDVDAAVDVSTQYRFALFSMIPRLLALHPFGLGVGDLPTGTFLIESSGHPIDISASVDSELVVLVLQLGGVGLIAYFSVLGLAIRNVVRGSSPSLGSWGLLAFTLCGLTVALHVWLTDAALWCLLIGIGLAALRSRSTSDQVADEPAVAPAAVGVSA
jgi:hypothetical protein